MKLQYDFSPETRALFYGVYACADCSQNVNLQLHHIFGRISDSPLNAIILCESCHKLVTGTRGEKVRYFLHTLDYLRRNALQGLTGHYKLTENDENFIRLIYPEIGTELSTDALLQ